MKDKTNFKLLLTIYTITMIIFEVKISKPKEKAS